MANTILTPTAVTREALRVLHQKLNFIGSITRDYDDSYAKIGGKIGDTLKIRLPNQYTYRRGPTLSAQDTSEQSVDLKINNQGGTDLNFTSLDLTLALDDFSERIIEPAMAVVAANMEADALTMYRDIYQQVNNQGAAGTLNKALQARKFLVDALAPLDGRSVVMNTQDNLDLVDGLKGLFNQQSIIGKQNREGYLGRTAGFDWTENTLLTTHPRGAENSAYTTDTTTAQMPVSPTALSAITVASGAGAGSQGDVFVIQGIYRVHPETKVSTGILQQFVLTAAYAGGAGSMQISPAIVTSGGRQNVTVVTASSVASLQFAGTASTAHGISLAFQKGAFAFATADMVMPKGVDWAAREMQDGISIRIVRQYDINNDKFPCRLDVLYGYKTIRPQLAARLANQ